MTEYDVAVIGGGPAGITAAVQAFRSDLKVVLFEKDKLGGLLHNANLVENYPYGGEGITGPELVRHFTAHLNHFDVELVKEEIISLIRKEDNNFVLKSRSNSYEVRSVIVAAGTLPTKLAIPGSDSVRSNRIFYEIKDFDTIPSRKNIVIVGGGDAVFDYSLNLAGYENKITILIRSGDTGCLPLLKRRVDEKTDYIRVKFNTEITRLEEDEVAQKLAVHIKDSDNNDILLTDYLMIAVGREPDDNLLKQYAKENSIELGNSLNGKTNIPGLYLAGDIRSGRFRQVGIAVGDGLKTAMMAAEFLKGAEKK